MKLTNQDKWNEMVEWCEKNRFVPEEKVQFEWESFFADSDFFGYSKRNGEIDNKRSITLGSKDRVIPDIIIRKDNKDLFVVELKQLCKPLDEKFRKQLFSYLKQLELNIGILICQSVYIYYFKGDCEYSYVNVPFKKDSQDGARIVELFSKDNYDREKIKDFIVSKTKKDKNINEIKELINNEYIIDLIKKDLQKGYDNDEIEEALNAFSIIAEKKTKMPPIIGGILVRDPRLPRPPRDDDSNNKLKALRLLYGLREEKKITDEMLRLFQDRDASNQIFRLNYKLLESNENNLWQANQYRFYPNDPIIINGTKYWICSQWAPFTKPDRDAFAKKYGIDLESNKYDNCFKR